MRKVGQAFLCFLASLLGLLATAASIESKEYLSAVCYASLTLGAIALGVWLIRRLKRELAEGSPNDTPSESSKETEAGRKDP